MAMTPEQFAVQVQQALGVQVGSVILYGSAVSGDHLGAKSDFNVLLVLDKLEFAQLQALAPVTQAWTNAGNHPPLLFTRESLREAADVFPIELLDIRDAHKVLAGAEVMRDVVVSDVHLRLQIEHELRGKLLHLQSQLLLTKMKPKAVAALLSASVSKFLILLRAALRLYVPVVPAKKVEAMHALTQHIAFDSEAFVLVQKLKEGHKATTVPVEALAERYLRAIAAVVQVVNDFKKETAQ